MRKDIVNAVSKNEEYTNVTSTVFNGVFGDGSACGGDLDKVLEYSRKAVGASRMNEVTVLVLMNSYRSAGTTYMLKPSSSAGYGEGASIAFLPYRNWNSTGYSKNDLTATLIHELVGHGIGKLDDEYSYSSLGRIPQDEIDYIKANKEKYGWYRNTDFTSDRPRSSGAHSSKTAVTRMRTLVCSKVAEPTFPVFTDRARTA